MTGVNRSSCHPPCPLVETSYRRDQGIRLVRSIDTFVATRPFCRYRYRLLLCSALLAGRRLSSANLTFAMFYRRTEPLGINEAHRRSDRLEALLALSLYRRNPRAEMASMSMQFLDLKEVRRRLLDVVPGCLPPMPAGLARELCRPVVPKSDPESQMDRTAFRADRPDSDIVVSGGGGLLVHVEALFCSYSEYPRLSLSCCLNGLPGGR